MTRSILEQAKRWLRRARRHHGVGSCLWHLLFHWEGIYPDLLSAIRQGTYCFSPRSSFSSKSCERPMWESTDAVVIKALSLYLEPFLCKATHAHCYHLKPNKGLKAGVKHAYNKAHEFKYVLKVDLKSYYQSMDHEIVYQQCAQIVKDRAILKVLWRAIKHVVVRDGVYTDVEQGVPSGLSLSNIFGALYLSCVDEYFAAQDGLFYIRYMDDILIMSNCKFKLRRSLKAIYSLMQGLKVDIHRGNKSFI